jgi:hypothetical protein
MAKRSARNQPDTPSTAADAASPSPQAGATRRTSARARTGRAGPGEGVGAGATKAPGSDAPRESAAGLSRPADHVLQEGTRTVSAASSPLPDRAQPDAEEIRRRAYLLYLERGRHDGADFDDWLRAERELKQQG